MVGTMLKSALREIRQSLGRYLAILAIVGLGVGFFSGLRTSQPAMMATGIEYLEEHYGIQIDRERYNVFYEGFASNIMPDITVIPATPPEG